VSGSRFSAAVDCVDAPNREPAELRVSWPWMDLMNDARQDSVRVTPGRRMQAALVLAVAADILQMIVFPLFATGAASPADDVLDLCLAGVLSFLLGWHWEFLPSFAGKLVPGVDLVPLWTLAVANVYRKSRRMVTTADHHPAGSTTVPGSQS
jgi:hypothetical protein